MEIVTVEGGQQEVTWRDKNSKAGGTRIFYNFTLEDLLYKDKHHSTKVESQLVLNFSLQDLTIYHDTVLRTKFPTSNIWRITNSKTITVDCPEYFGIICIQPMKPGREHWGGDAAPVGEGLLQDQLLCCPKIAPTIDYRSLCLQHEAWWTPPEKPRQQSMPSVTGHMT